MTQTTKHKWMGQQAGGPPDEATSYEWIAYCSECGAEQNDNNEDEECYPDDAEIKSILAMTDTEVLAQATPEDLADAERIGRNIKYMTRCFSAGWNAALDKAKQELGAPADVVLTLNKLVRPI